jgi:hypothetical protein
MQPRGQLTMQPIVFEAESEVRDSDMQREPRMWVETGVYVPPSHGPLFIPEVDVEVTMEVETEERMPPPSSAPAGAGAGIPLPVIRAGQFSFLILILIPFPRHK